MDKPHVYAIADTAIREMIRGSFSKGCISIIAYGNKGLNLSAPIIHLNLQDFVFVVCR